VWICQNASLIHPVEHAAIRIRTVKCKVPSQHVVHIPIVIVIDTICRFVETVRVFSDLTRVVPKVVSDVRMVITEAII